MFAPEDFAAISPTTVVAQMAPLIDVDAACNVVLSTGRVGPDHVRGVRVPIAHLVTDHDAMVGVLGDVDGGQVSETPGEAVDLCVRGDEVGRYEVSDGHHRIAAALLAGQTYVVADIWPLTDDEPYEGPFFDFAAAEGLIASRSPVMV